MKDIDFDELDKAVNSLMSATPGATTPASTPVASTPVTPAAAEAPVEVTKPTPSVATPTVDPQPPAAARPVVPAQRRSGRFMDVVHPSSDMKTASAQPSREGVTIAPRADATPIASAPAPTPATEPAVPAPTNEPAASSWPDPIELAANATSSTEQAPTPIAEPAPVAPEPVSQPLDASADQPTDSPFLPDAKVEKRPLNAGTPPETDSEPAEQDAPEPTDNKNDGPVPVVPAELNSDLVAIESNEPSQAAADDEKAADTTVPADHRLEDRATAPSGPASIVQQYREQPSTGDQSHAAIYDATQYAEPLSHPPKKKSGWLWVVWVVLLLVLGAGGAVALYMAGII